jgi:crotonobetainyl-CoA:carnitine CoA-transferase CaiB-like acyl-CoA transferase
MSKTPVSYRRAPPALGQDNVELLRELGYSDEQLDRLRNKQVI